MKLLDTTIIHDERILKQLQRTGRIAIYQLRAQHNNLVYGYEVIKIAVIPERERFGFILPSREIYPADSQFGSKAWSFGKNHEKQAFEKFDALVHAESENSTPTLTPTVVRPEFRHSGRTYTQLKRDGQVALYKLSGAGYEVVVIRQQKAKVFKGLSIPAREAMPDISQWGKYGWSFLPNDLAGAEKRYESLLPKWGEHRDSNLRNDREDSGAPLLEELSLAGGCN